MSWKYGFYWQFSLMVLSDAPYAPHLSTKNDVKRIVIVGNSGAGKSTLAAQLSRRLGLPCIASAPFYWERGWVPASPEVVRQRLVDAVAGDGCVIGGNCVAEQARRPVQRSCSLLRFGVQPAAVAASSSKFEHKTRAPLAYVCSYMCPAGVQ